ncbi:MAG TPA: cation transporter [Lachnospiraceae bacterium]
MANVLVLVILLLVIILGLISAVKHFKGQGSCCGGGSDIKSQKKILQSPKIAQKTLIIEGMTCNHCKNTVENALNTLDGVAAEVDLKDKKAYVSMSRLASDKELKEAVESRGYQVKEILS